MFDIAQSGFAGDHHVFVDVDVSCGDVSASPVGLPTAVAVVVGPASSLGSSGHCLMKVDGNTVTASVGTGARCATFGVPRPIELVHDGRSTHLVRIPDGNIGQVHQLLVWVDADRDGVYDFREPYQYVAADFVGRASGGRTLVDFGLPDDFVVKLVEDRSDKVGRGGHDTELRLRLETRLLVGHSFSGPVTVTASLANALVGVLATAGPSADSKVMCLSPSGAVSQCRTDADGEITVRYGVGTGGVSVLSRTEDLLAVFHDPDADGRRTFGAPISYYARSIAKAVNYVALGDSCSAGENGEKPTAGAYENDADSADGECRRWNKAYSYVFKKEFLDDTDVDTDVEFATFACTGAITLNIFDPADATGSSLLREHVLTNLPSSKADELGGTYDFMTGNLIGVVEPDTWEPRQAVSLAGVQAMRGVVGHVLRWRRQVRRSVRNGRRAGFRNIYRRHTAVCLHES